VHRHIHSVEKYGRGTCYVVVTQVSLPAVLASVGCSWMASQYFAEDLNGALKVAGSFGSPLLYGVLPVVRAYTQRQKVQKAAQQIGLPNFGLGLLGAVSTGFMGANELVQRAGYVMSSMVSI
jgi:hypothetical protein